MEGLGATAVPGAHVAMKTAETLPTVGPAGRSR